MDNARDAPAAASRSTALRSRQGTRRTDGPTAGPDTSFQQREEQRCPSSVPDQQSL